MLNIFKNLNKQNNKINFLFFDDLPYKLRFLYTVIIFIIGIFIQVFGSFYVGLPFLIFAVVFNFVRGFHIIYPEIKNKKWEKSTINEVENILNLHKKNLSWDSDFIDISCIKGFISLVLILIIWYFFKSSIFIYFEYPFNLIFTIDPLILLIPFWVTGVRTIYQNNELIIKTRSLLFIYNNIKNIKEIVIEPFLYLGLASDKEDKKIPIDIRFLIKLKGQPENFIGIQIQVSLNYVQSAAYPYIYCVILAKKDFNLFNKLDNLGLYNSRKIIFERSASHGTRKNEDDVDVLVIRQYTTRTSGYHTKNKTALNIFLKSFSIAKQLNNNSAFR